MSFIWKVFLMTLLAISPALAGAAPINTAPINVWPGLAPSERSASPGRISDDHSGNVKRLTDVTQPQIIAFPVSGPEPHPAVLVLPGGGYSILSIDLEGDDIARWLNGLGFSAFVLHYRVPDNRTGAFQDAQRAMSLLRARSKEYDIDPKRLGILGFSAGGHLAARLASGFGTRAYPTVGDAADAESCRPDFCVLVYPAYLVDAKTGLIAAEVQPHKDTPPTFITQTRDDPYFDADAYADALVQAGVPTAKAIYPKGGHGYGLRLPAADEAHAWSTEAGKWLQTQAHVSQ